MEYSCRLNSRKRSKGRGIYEGDTDQNSPGAHVDTTGFKGRTHPPSIGHARTRQGASREVGGLYLPSVGLA